jgi:hypothetical protein
MSTEISEVELDEQTVLERAMKFLKVKAELSGVEPYSEDWYRQAHPGFPDEYYPIFAKFSAETKLEPEPDKNIDTK